MSTPGGPNRPAAGSGDGPLRAPAHGIVRGAIDAMREPARLVLTLHYYENLGPDSIARALETPVGEVERLLDQGKADVARSLASRILRAGDSGRHAD